MKPLTGGFVGFLNLRDYREDAIGGERKCEKQLAATPPFSVLPLSDVTLSLLFLLIHYYLLVLI